jgi:hypothetical protein
MQETPAGHEIPVPTRGDVFADLAKVAKAKPPKPSDDDSAAREGSTEQE